MMFFHSRLDDLICFGIASWTKISWTSFKSHEVSIQFLVRTKKLVYPNFTSWRVWCWLSCWRSANWQCYLWTMLNLIWWDLWAFHVGDKKNLRLKLMLIACCLVYTWFETALHQTNTRKSGHRLCRPGRHGNWFSFGFWWTSRAMFREGDVFFSTFFQVVCGGIVLALFIVSSEISGDGSEHGVSCSNWRPWHRGHCRQLYGGSVDRWLATFLFLRHCIQHVAVRLESICKFLQRRRCWISVCKKIIFKISGVVSVVPGNDAACPYSTRNKSQDC